MSKASRERARAAQQSNLPRVFVIVGVLAVLGVSAVAARSVLRDTSSAAGAPSAVAMGGAVGTDTPASAQGKQLLFFMNPDGYPCQVQLSMLNGVADSLAKVAQVVYVKTTEPADIAKFEAYGIRGLPSLVIADASGRELTRFAPGIQSAESVLAALSK